MSDSRNQGSNCAHSHVVQRYVSRGDETPTATASEYLHHIEDFNWRGCSAFLYCRVSSRTQDANGNLQRQVEYETQRLAEIGLHIEDVFQEVGSGWELERSILYAAACRALREQGFLIARSTERFIRSRDYNSETAPYARPTEFEFERLIEQTQSVPLVTRLHPDAPWRVVRSEETRCGQLMSGNCGGRPSRRRRKYKPRASEDVKQRARELRAQKWTLRQIEQELGYRHSTIAGWLRDE